MKVSAHVESYIEQQVGKKIKEKYQKDLENEKALNARLRAIKGELVLELSKKGNEFILEDELIKTNPLFSFDPKALYISCGVLLQSTINDKVAEEIREKIQEILVSLELGGSMEDLERLLSEV